MPAHDWTRVGSGIFHAFHNRWTGALQDHLNDGILPADYYALAEQVAGGPQPDVIALEGPVTPDRGARWTNSNRAGAIDLLECPPKVTHTEKCEREIYARTATHVAVYHSAGDRVVAFIEIVSPGNKHSAYETSKFIDKLLDALDRGIHLLVVDVHPPGKHDRRGIHAGFWEFRSAEAHGVSAERPLGFSAYRSDTVPTAYFEPIAVGDALPEMPIFLTPDLYVNVPLEATYMESWRGVPQRWKEVIETGEGSQRQE